MDRFIDPPDIAGMDPTQPGLLSPVLLTARQMTQCEQLVIAAGKSSFDLMKSAGRAVSDFVQGRLRKGRIVVMCGPGNNGGDGYVAAQSLQESGYEVDIVSLGDPSQLKGDAFLAARAWRGKFLPLNDARLHQADIIIDAVFGTGLSRDVDGPARAMVDSINQAGRTIVAIDIPSGIDSDTGHIRGAAVRADHTVTFFRLKPGHRLYPGRDHCGKIIVADIGIEQVVLEAVQPHLFRNHPALWFHCWPFPTARTHKYTRGYVLILGGSMPGAARLAALTARRMGAGYVSIAANQADQDAYRSVEAGTVIRFWSDNADWQRLIEERPPHAVILGPGIQQSDPIKPLILQTLSLKIPTLLDAGALTLFADNPQRLFEELHNNCVLTPHGGEFRRIFPNLSSVDRLSAAMDAARLSGAVIVSKGPDTIVATPDGQANINDVFAPDLATAGTGDVLSGAIGAFLAQGLSANLAAAAAVWIHAKAAAEWGTGLIAEDLPLTMSRTLKRLRDVLKR